MRVQMAPTSVPVQSASQIQYREKNTNIKHTACQPVAASTARATQHCDHHRATCILSAGRTVGEVRLQPRLRQRLLRLSKKATVRQPKEKRNVPSSCVLPGRRPTAYGRPAVPRVSLCHVVHRNGFGRKQTEVAPLSLDYAVSVATTQVHHRPPKPMAMHKPVKTRKSRPSTKLRVLRPDSAESWTICKPCQKNRAKSPGTVSCDVACVAHSGGRTHTHTLLPHRGDASYRPTTHTHTH